MKKHYFILPVILLVCMCQSFAQIVANSSFETLRPEVQPCPSSGSSPTGITFAAANWDSRPLSMVSGQYATSDYFTSCMGNTIYEAPRTGSAYAGFLAYRSSFGTYAEYLQQSITLTGGTTYTIEFYVSLSEDAGRNITPGASVNSIGMFLTTDLTVINNPKPSGALNYFNLTPQIPNQFPASSTYSNTNGWTKISGTFTPAQTGTYYILIGNFRQPTDGLTSYYYIDDVNICGIDVNNTRIMGADNICGAATYTLQNQPSGSSVTWTSSNPAGVSVDQNGNATINNGFMGVVTISASINQGCSSPIVISKNVTVGVPTPSIIREEITSDPGEPTVVEFTATPYPNVTYKWYRGSVLSQSSTNNTYDTYIPCRTTVNVSCEIVTVCGTSARSAPASSTGECCRTNCPRSIVTNPVQDKVQVTMINDPAVTGSNYSLLQVRILDTYGVVKKKVVYNKTKEAEVDVSDLKNGPYFIEILDSQGKQTKQLVIQR